MLLWLQITLTCVTSLAAVSVWVVCRRVSVSSRLTKRMNDLETTMSDLQSSFESLLESHKRLRSRTGMRELREQPKQESKADIRRRLFGVASGPDFAREQVRRAHSSD